MESVRVLAHMTDVEAAHRGHAHAVDRVRELEAALESAFQALHNARQDLKQRAGVDARTDFTEAVTCAWDRWLATEQVRERSEVPGWPLSDEAREAEAVRLGNAGASAAA